MAAPAEEDFLSCLNPDWELFADLNKVQADEIAVDTTLVQNEHSYTSIYKELPCYNDDSTNTLAPSLIEIINDDSSVDSFSSAGNATYLSSLENFQTKVDQPHYNYHGPKIVLPINESHVTICTANTINMVKSCRLL